ncbi:MAG TPA: ATP-binding protein, partial [Telluria sp.]|nr:ATP-binding protein [Telluria sp.]
RVNRPDDKEVWAFSTSELLSDENGRPLRLVGAMQNITARKRAERAMTQAAQDSDAANRAKSEFLANMSHEIRTPMNGILGMTELVLQSPLTDEQREDLSLVQASALSLLTIVNDILDFSKIEAGKLDIEDVPFDLARLVAETARSMALRAQQKNLQLVCELPPDLPRTVKGDPGRLRQVLLNLLGNAVKFTGQGRVVLRVDAGPEEDGRCLVRFAVSDTGIGIPPEKQKLIFEAFAQVDGSTTREYGGTGLGLTICRRLVILMQGSMELESAPGAGSTFRFTIPLRPTGVSLQTALPEDWEQPLPPATAAPVPPPESGADGLRVLLAEDNPVNQRLAVRLLQKMGHRVHLVDNGLAALECAQRAEYDLIFMDVQMPGLDGLSVTRQLRQQEAGSGRHVPIVAMTARAMQGDRERCLEAGMDDYLSKPIDSARLRQVVAQFGPHEERALPDWRDALQRLDGDVDLYLELAGLFLADGPSLLESVRSALAAGDLAASQRAVHSLKGVLANFGARDAVERAEQLTVSLHDPAQEAQWAAQAEALAETLEKVYAELRELTTAGPAGFAALA